MRHFIADINHWGKTSIADRTKEVMHQQKHAFFHVMLIYLITKHVRSLSRQDELLLLLLLL